MHFIYANLYLLTLVLLQKRMKQKCTPFFHSTNIVAIILLIIFQTRDKNENAATILNQ